MGLMEESELLAKLGVYSVFNQVNMDGPDQAPRMTQAYGNRTGGVQQGNTNLTKAHAFQTATDRFDTGDYRAWMTTLPEIEYLLSELDRRNISQRFGGLFLHDDTVAQVSYVVNAADFLQKQAPWLIPIVNQVSGNSAPETLYRSQLYISSPEQYPISGCTNAICDPKSEVASQLRDTVLEVPCGATRCVSRAFGRRPHRRISATKSAGSGILYRHFEWWLV